MLKHASTYEIMRPQDVGLNRNSLVLGKHSGRHAFRDRVKSLGFDLDEAELNRVWMAQVFEPYQRTLASKYPFDRSSRMEAAPACGAIASAF